MLHPETELRWVSSEKGYGIFARAAIPRGTITFITDALDIVIPPGDPRLKDENLRPFIEKYSYMDGGDELVISWDHGKYMNHCCFPNTLTTGYGLEIAVKDIKAGEEMTDDYGIFSSHHTMNFTCSLAKCRRRIDVADFDSLVEFWDDSIQKALLRLFYVEQPLRYFLNEKTLKNLKSFIETGKGYISVANQKPCVKKNV